MFADREDAGRRLADALAAHLGDVTGVPIIVLAIPRGGVIVGEIVADRLAAALDVVVPRKLGSPGNPELGLGAIAPGVRVLDQALVRALGVDDSYLEAAIEREEREIARRQETYRDGMPPLDIHGQVCIVVDDGVATGGTAIAALRWARAQGAERVILAVPVAPSLAVRRLEREADEVIALATPEPFFAVGQWYEQFGQASDEEVVAALKRSAAATGSEVSPE